MEQNSHIIAKSGINFAGLLLAARHLGSFNGAYLTGWPLPEQAWLRVDWLRSYVEEYAPAVVRFFKEHEDDPQLKPAAA